MNPTANDVTVPANIDVATIELVDNAPIERVSGVTLGSEEVSFEKAEMLSYSFG